MPIYPNSHGSGILPNIMEKRLVMHGILIAYHEEGRGDRAVIFLHGWRSNGTIWRPLIDCLEIGKRTLYSLDLPGFGMSETPKECLTVGDYADIVKGFVDAVCPEKDIVLVGHSFGARIAVKIAAEDPEWLARLVLIGSGGADMNAAERGAKKAIAKFAKPFFKARFMQPLRKRLYTMIGAGDYVETPELKETFVNVIGEDIAPLFPKVMADTLVIWGEKDDMAPLAYGKKIAAKIPNADLEIVENAGHYCFVEKPAECAELIREFLEKK